MTDLSGIARQLRLSVDQLRIAADLLEQGYQPSFIARYRADETGKLSKQVIWSLKLEIDRQKRLQVARDKAQTQLPKDSELDDEAKKALERATSETDIEVALRCWRARRNMGIALEKDSAASALLEKLIAYEGKKPEDITAWVASELGCSPDEASAKLSEAQQLVATILQGDTRLAHELRSIVCKKAQIQVEMLDAPASNPKQAEEKTDEPPNDANAVQLDTESAKDSNVTVPAPEAESTAEETDSSDAATAEAPAQDSISEAASPISEDQSTSATEEPSEAASSSDSPTDSASEADSSTAEENAESVAAELSTDATAVEESATVPDQAKSEAEQGEVSQEVESWSKPGERKKTAAKESKSLAKMTPRQRRRRWLVSMIQPMKSLKKNIGKLTAYQQLMLGRGRRSQIVKTNLKYDERQLINICRDAFVRDKHGMASWFTDAAKAGFETSVQSRIEADTLAFFEERAQERLLESATDQLRKSLTQRPVRGHVILVVDTIGPKTASVAVISPEGSVLHTDEIICSAQPDAISQNMVKLGEIAHQYRVSMIALTNGPARRFLVLSVKELITASEGKLRWTMADRGGAEAYAISRTALKELPAHNKRDRAAIWIGRSLQDPLKELLKVDVNRLRLGSYQRELPQEPLKELIQATISDCVSDQGLDTQHASVESLRSVAGVADEQAQQIATLAAQGNLRTREQLLADVTNWDSKDSRQAIGFLRVYSSEQPLDATLIHPEDYKLADRLVSNTDHETPPNSPEGWNKPEPISESSKPSEDDALSGQPTTEASEAVDGEATDEVSVTGDRPTTEESQIAADSSSDAVAADDSDEASSADKSNESAEQQPVADAEVTEANPESTPSDSASNSESESESTEESTASLESGKSEGSGGETSEETTEGATATEEVTAANSIPTVTPEYSEDVLAAQNSDKRAQLAIDTEKLARGWQVGREKLKWIARCLHEPFADPRLDGTPIPMLAEVPSLTNLQADQCLWAVVVGVADFGAFVELGPDCSGLIHISRLSANYVEDPHQVVQVGDLIMVWVVSIDEKKNRVALTALSPEQRKAAAESEQQERGSRDQRGGPPRGDRRSSGGKPGTRGGRNESGGQRGGQPGGKPRGAGGQGDRQRRPGGGGRGRPGGGRSGRRDERRTSKPVIVESKKPKEAISDAMKEGDEPLRSFSDLMQFYEAKRTDVPAPKSPSEDTAAAPPESTQPEAATPATAESQEQTTAAPTDTQEGDSTATT
ncbi:MAG: S1 RNA-binding domain-containing protein [Aureliella sp.]